MKPYPSRNANQDRLRKSCPPELPSIHAGWQCALTSSAGIQTIPVESPLRRSVPESALTLPGPPGPGSMESTERGLCCPHPSEFPPSVPSVADMSVAPAPDAAGRETPPYLRLPLPQTSPVNSRCSVIGLGLPIGFLEGLLFTDVHIQTPEPPSRFGLRLDV